MSEPKRPTRKKEEEPRDEQIPEIRFEPEAKVERATFTGQCDLQPMEVSRTNGQAHTLKWPKNVGTCKLSLYCEDKDGNEMKDTTKKLEAGDQIESYTSAAGAKRIVFECGYAFEGTCILEIDR